jgi:hypothetical protein
MSMIHLEESERYPLHRMGLGTFPEFAMRRAHPGFV